jgi:hypothetical protein
VVVKAGKSKTITLGLLFSELEVLPCTLLLPLVVFPTPPQLHSHPFSPFITHLRIQPYLASRLDCSSLLELISLTTVAFAELIFPANTLFWVAALWGLLLLLNCPPTNRARQVHLSKIPQCNP